jgi:hypothetical protein
MTLMSCKYFDRIERKERNISETIHKIFLFICRRAAASEKKKKRKTLNNSKTVVLIKDVRNSFRASRRRQNRNLGLLFKALRRRKKK